MADGAERDGRNRWQPSRWLIPLVERSAAAWEARAAPCPLLTDLHGEELRRGAATIALAWDGAALLISAIASHAPHASCPELAPDHPKFWRQDHIEFRLGPTADAAIQFIFTPHGRWFDSLGLWKNPESKIGVEPSAGAEGWRLQARLPLQELGFPIPRTGDVWRGLGAHLQWRDGGPVIAASSAAPLGFAQRERLGELIFGPAADAILERIELPVERIAAGENRAAIQIKNLSAQPLSGAIVLTQEFGENGPASAEERSVELRAMSSTPVAFALHAERPLYRRVRVSLREASGLTRELGAVTLRAAPPEPEFKASQHPYLYFDEPGVAAFRHKCAQPFFAPLAAELQPKDADFNREHLQVDSGFSFEFDATSMHWFRVAKETMLHGGEKHKHPAARRIWESFSAQAQAAWRDVVRAVEPTNAHLSILVPELNALLRRRDWYEAQAFADVALPPQGRSLLERGLERISEAELIRFNRILFQSAVECCGKFKVDLAGRAGSYLAKWLASGDARLIRLASSTAQAAADWMIPEATFHLHEGNCTPLLALSYDTFYPHLTEAERGHWRRLLTIFLDLYLQSARASAWTVTTIANANPVSSAGAGFVALALWREEPEKAREVLCYCRKFVTNWLDYCTGPDGGNTEGAQYWQYGCESWIRFAAVYQKMSGADEGLLDHPGLRNGMNMVRVSLCNDGALHGVNDTIPTPVGAEIAWYWAARYGDPFALWYGDHHLRWMTRAKEAQRQTGYRASPFWAILFRPDVQEMIEQPEPLPEAFALHSIEYGMLRSGPQWDCTLTAGLKGSRPPYTHHNQADTGAFFIDLRGQRLLMDPGYYKPEPAQHSLPIIDSVAPQYPSEWVGRITACGVRGPLRWLVCDVTRAYRGAARRVVRHLIMAGDEGVVLLDDIAGARRVVTQFQAGAAVKNLCDGRGALIANDRAKLRLDLLTAPEMKLTFEPERSLQDVHWGYAFADCRWFPITGAYAADEDEPLVCSFLDATAAAPPAPRVLRTEGALSVALPSGLEVRFRLGVEGWGMVVQ